MKKITKGKVFVGMSGGVDSSVSAYLLQKAGYDVTGVFIKVWQPDFVECTWKKDRLDAMRVAAQLDIPFITIDAEAEYKKHVVDYMLGEYKAGRTPNPDVMCNKYVKFGAFFDFAMKNGADFVATGHYARVRRTGTLSLEKGSGPTSELLTSIDPDKDQSYFLYQINQAQLSKTLFPIGDLKKSEVRKIAEKAKLFTASKKDSQGLCFIGKIDMQDFLKEFIETKPGSVLDERGKIIGKHEGAELYTIGQRHGFSITEKTPSDSKYFVISRDTENNTITVSSKESAPIEIAGLTLTDTNWFSGKRPSPDKKYKCQIRYHGEFLSCNFRNREKATEILFETPQNFISPGQSCVVYDGEVCLGGGIIAKVNIL